MSGAAASLELQLRPVGGAALAADGPLPHLRLIAMHTTIVMPTGSVPGAPPMGNLIIGEPYDITASGAVVPLEKPAVLTMHYDATLVNRVTPAGLSIFYWRPGQQSWEPVPSRVDEAQRTVAAQIRTLGVYALFAPAGPWAEAEGARVWLPGVSR